MINGTDFFAPIPIGAKIKNNGVKLGLFSDSSSTTRKDIINNEEWIATFEVNVIRTLEVAGNVRLDIDTKVSLLNGLDIDGNKISDDSVDIKKLSFVETGTNIYDRESDEGFAEGKYINQYGELIDNSSYNTSGFIPAAPNTAYSYVTGENLRFALEFDADKQPINGTFVSEILTIQTSASTRYIRVTFFASGDYFLCKGNEPKPYEDFKLLIPNEYLQTEPSGNELPFFLPKNIYVANGRTIEIYYNQVLLNADRYNIQATCSIGKAL